MLRTHVSWSLLVLIGLSLAACSGDGDGSQDDDASSEAQGDASDTEDGPDAQQSSDAGTDASTGMDAAIDAGTQSGMDGGTSGDAGCTGASCDACKVALYLMADLSGSMGQPVVSGSAYVGDAGPRDAGMAGDAGDAGDAARPPPNNRIDAMKNALHAFIDDPSAAGAQLGLGHFPHELANDAGTCAPGSECGAGGTCCPGGNTCLVNVCFPFAAFAPSCNVADYAKPDLELGEHVAVANAWHGAIDAMRANGQSPEIVALEGALSYARTKVAPRNKVSVVLFADGPWNACGPIADGGAGTVQAGGPVEPLAEVAARYAMGSPSVTTYVVAIRGDGDAGYFDPVATAGGTQVYNASSGDELLAALKAIRVHAAAACK